MNDILRVAADTLDIEMRFPYFDRRFIEFCVALPVDQKMREGQSRSILRRAMKDILPPVVQSRFSKGNLSYNFNKALVEHGKTLINQTLRKSFGYIDQYVDFEDMKNNFDRYLHDPMHCNQEAFNVFLVVTLCKWLKHSGL
jgi:asparagine synthase (glutamine-hydrolysing)